MEAVARVGSLQLKILNMGYTKRILFKVSNRLYLKLNEGCKQASAKWRACKHPKINKRASERASERAERIT